MRLLTLIGVAVIWLPQLALACSCEGQSVREARANAAFVVEGIITELEEIPLDDYGTTLLFATAEIDRAWKGADDLGRVEDRWEVYFSTAVESSACGYRMAVGERHLLFISGGSTNDCSHSSGGAERMQALREALGPARVPEGDGWSALPEDEGCRQSAGSDGATAGWLWLLAVIGVWRRRRSRSA